MNWRVVHDRLANDLTFEVKRADHVIPVLSPALMPANTVQHFLR